MRDSPKLTPAQELIKILQDHNKDTELYRFLVEQIDAIPNLLLQAPFGPEYKVWKNTTKKLVLNYLGDEALKMFDANFRPKQILQKGQEVRAYEQALRSAKILLDNLMKEKARFGANGLKAVEPSDANMESYSFHPIIYASAGKLLEDGHFNEAIRKAEVEVLTRVKRHVYQSTGEEVDGMNLINKVFSEKNPLITVTPMQTQEDRNEQEAISFLFKATVGIRNVNSHENQKPINQLMAIEFLALASLLMRYLDVSKVK